MEHEIKGGRWVSPETFAKERDDLPLDLVLNMLKKSHRSKKTFDERDVERFARGHVRIYVTKPNGAGVHCPRIIDRPPRASGRKKVSP